MKPYIMRYSESVQIYETESIVNNQGRLAFLQAGKCIAPSSTFRTITVEDTDEDVYSLGDSTFATESIESVDEDVLSIQMDVVEQNIMTIKYASHLFDHTVVTRSIENSDDDCMSKNLLEYDACETFVTKTIENIDADDMFD